MQFTVAPGLRVSWVRGKGYVPVPKRAAATVAVNKLGLRFLPTAARDTAAHSREREVATIRRPSSVKHPRPSLQLSATRTL